MTSGIDTGLKPHTADGAPSGASTGPAMPTPNIETAFKQAMGLQPASPRIDWKRNYASRASRMTGSETRELLKLLSDPTIISFAGGVPNPKLIPEREIAGALKQVMDDPAARSQALQYSATEGYGPLRAWVSDRMAQNGVACSPDNVLITSGSQQGLDLLGKMLLSPADTALVTAPTYLGAVQAYDAYEPHFDTITPGDQQRDAASYQNKAATKGGQVKFAYVMPDFANPSGETLDRAARNKVLDLTEQLDIPVIEDAAYTDLHFNGKPAPSLLALDVQRHGSIDQSRVVYLGTTSKTLSPGLRIGYIVAAKEIIDQAVLAKQGTDLHTPTLNQMVIAKVARKIYAPQIKILQTQYQKRRNLMVSALEQNMPEGVSWTVPQGGLFVWLKLPEGLNSKTMFRRALDEQKVAFVPGTAFFADRSGANTLRLSFSTASEPKIAEGMRRLGAVIRAEMQDSTEQATVRNALADAMSHLLIEDAMP